MTTLAACAPGLPSLPSGAGTPFPGFRAAYEEAVSACRGVRSFAALLGLSGRVGSTRLRGRIEAGFAEPGLARLEMIAGFGSRPVFTLVARDDLATLVFPRDGRVLRGARPEEVIEVLAGVSLGPDELRGALAGCGFGPVDPISGLAHPGDWVALNAGPTTVWLRRVAESWRVMAASRGQLEVRYADYSGRRPATVRFRTAVPGGADIVLRLSQVDINVDFGPEVFEIRVPEDATPLTLEELRRAGPLGVSGTDQ